MKIKSKIKDCRLIVKVKLSFREKIYEKEFETFSRIFIRGFLKPQSVKRNCIEYSGPLGISLSERFRKPVKKRDFFFIMEQIVVMAQKLEKNELSPNYLVLNTEHVFINENTKELQFLYVPIEGLFSKVTILEFMEQIICSVHLDDEGETDYVSRFSFFLKQLHNFDVEMIEQYISKEDRSVVNTIKKQNVGQSDFMTNKRQQYYEHYQENESESKEAERRETPYKENTYIENTYRETPYRETEEKTGLRPDNWQNNTLSYEQDYEKTGLLVEDWTGVFDNYATGNSQLEETGLLDEEELPETELLYSNQTVHYPSLVRILTEERISINKQVFRLGKERSYVDYFINNNAVSRSHADIIIRGNRCFVNDLNSKNHTYINGKQIPVNCETEIRNGDCLKLGNEEFIFYE